jgi:predicted porin
VGVRYKTPKTLIVLYGIVEPTLSAVNNAYAYGGSKIGYQVSWFSGNRWGITGNQSLVKDDSIKAIWRLESEFELPTGNMDTHDVLFNRDAWMGFESVLGKITFGRQNTLARDFSQNYGDPYGTTGVRFEEGGWTNVNNFKQLIYFAGGPSLVVEDDARKSTPDTRYTNGIVWKRAFGKYVMVGAGAQLGNGEGRHFTDDTALSVGLALNANPVSISGFFTEANNHGFNQHAASVGGNWTVSILRVNAGVFHYEADQAALGIQVQNAATLSGTIKLTDPLELDLGYQKIWANNAAYRGNGQITQPFGSTAGLASTGTGWKGTLYGSLIYKFSRAAQIYLAADHMQVAGGYSVNGAVAGKFAGDGLTVPASYASAAHSSQIEVAAGTRLIF